MTVDDAQWIDASSLRALGFVSALVRDATLVITVAFVPSADEASANRDAVRVVSEMVRQPITRLVELHGLSASSVEHAGTRGAPRCT